MFAQSCQRCQEPMRLTKRLIFPEGAIKLIFECSRCTRAVVEEEHHVEA